MGRNSTSISCQGDHLREQVLDTILEGLMMMEMCRTMWRQNRLFTLIIYVVLTYRLEAVCQYFGINEDIWLKLKS